MSMTLLLSIGEFADERKYELHRDGSHWNISITYFGGRPFSENIERKIAVPVDRLSSTMHCWAGSAGPFAYSVASDVQQPVWLSRVTDKIELVAHAQALKEWLSHTEFGSKDCDLMRIVRALTDGPNNEP
eukprot:ANDGO_00530.mRNA.1 hypothetical protein